MKAKGVLKGKEIILDKDLGIEGEVEVDIELTLPEEVEKEAFGIWRGREDIRDSTEWVRKIREKEWQRY